MEQIMRKIPAVLLAGLIAVAAAFAVGAFTAQEAYAEVEIEHLYVGDSGEITTTGVILNTGASGTATVSTDEETNSIVLTLENFSYEGAGNGYASIDYLCSNTVPLVIKLIGENSVACTKEGASGIRSDVDLTITSDSDGTLDVSGEATGIYKGIKSLTIKDCAVTAAGVDVESLAVNDGSLDADGGNYGIQVGPAGAAITGDSVVTATGSTKAINGPVKNAIPGKGWDNKDGIGNAEDIQIDSVDSNGQRLDYKKVVFAPHKHKDAEGNVITFQPHSNPGYLPDGEGNYFLTCDVTLNSPWALSGTYNLCLNGHSITVGTGGRINIGVGKILNLYDCGTSGSITNNSGAGINVSGGTFNMYGGTISGCRDSVGGGVCVNGGAFNMYGGTISGNSAEQEGGGVCVHGGTFNMSGGTISGNSAEEEGGGIFVATGNISLSGSPQITGNTVNNNANNIYLDSDAKAVITNELTTPEGASGPQIGVTMFTPRVFTSGLAGKLPSGKTASNVFFSDDTSYVIKETDDHEARLGRPVEMNGDGTAAAPYEITSYADLKEFASIVNGTHRYAPKNTAACGKLMKDITCDDKKWVPIGNEDSPYTGHFNGNNMMIVNLSNEETGAGENYQGLFGTVGQGSRIINVGIVGGKIVGDTYVGGVVGSNGANGIINGCYNTGAVSGDRFVGGVAGSNLYSGEIANCYNTGAVSGTKNGIGGVVGYSAHVNANRVMTNCYNTGVVSGKYYIGGVVGHQLMGKITNCYSTGAVSGERDFGGVVGFEQNGTITNCYYDKTFGMATDAVGATLVDENIDVRGLTTSQMTGTLALNNMVFSYTSGEENPWLKNANGIDPESRDYYLYYPHLKGFAYDSSKSAADWPAKVIVDADWNESESYTYNASDQKPTVTRITVSAEPVAVPEGASASYSKWDGSGWTGSSSDDPTTPGVYKLSYTVSGDSHAVIFSILEPENDYTVEYLLEKETGKQITAAVNAGDYKAIVKFTNWPYLEKEFKISPAPLTITAKDQTLTYNGQIQGPGDAAYEDPAEIAKRVTAEGLQGSDELTKIEVDGQGKEVGEYALIPNAAAIGTATANYAITYVNGTLRITKPQPKPQPTPPQPTPQPTVNKAAAKTALDAGVVAKSSGSKVTASWGAVKGASSYVIYANYCDKKKCRKIKTVSGKTTSFSITKLNGKKFNPKKNLKFYVVAYQKVNGKNVKLARSIMAHAPGSKNSGRTNVTGVKVKKASFTLKKGKTAKIKGKLILQKKGKKPLKHEAKFRYASSNKKVAKVSKKGKITAVGKGKCTVYVYAVSGVSKKIKVTVR